MASNDPIASKARKPALSIEDAERFASQIRPSWELLGPDGAAADFGLDDAPLAAAPSAGAGGRAADTIIEGVPTVAVGGSDEAIPVDTSWDVDEPAKASEPAGPPIEAQVITSIGIPSKAEVPVNELQLPPQVGHPMVPTPRAPIAPSPPAKTKVGVGGTSGERAPMAKPTSTRPPAPVSARAATAPASAKPAASKSRPGATNPGTSKPSAAYVPAAGEADDDIAIPISGASKGLLLKIGGGVAVLAVILIAVKVFSGSSKPDPVKTTPTAVVTTAAVAAPPPLDPTLVDPPKPTTAPTVAATTAPATAATTAPTAKEKPVVAKVEPPTPPVTTAKKPLGTPPASTGTTPAGPAKKGGGIIRETPF
ncbi:MAG: hypothetical protein ABJE95_14980 [Byssovorax sp.]